jgi:hypothetical protein
LGGCHFSALGFHSDFGGMYLSFGAFHGVDSSVFPSALGFHSDFCGLNEFSLGFHDDVGGL